MPQVDGMMPAIELQCPQCWQLLLRRPDVLSGAFVYEHTGQVLRASLRCPNTGKMYTIDWLEAGVKVLPVKEVPIGQSE